MRHLFKPVVSLVVLSTSVAYASGDFLDDSLIDYVRSVRETSESNLKDNNKKIRAKKTELSKNTDSDELKWKKEKLDKEKAKFFLVRDLQTKAFDKFNSADEMQRLLTDAFINDSAMKEKLQVFNKELEQRKSDLTNKVEKPTEVKPIEAPIALDGSPAHLVATLSTNEKNKPTIEFRFESSDAQYDFASDQTKKSLDTTDIQSAVGEFNAKLFKNKMEIVGFSADKPQEWVDRTAKLSMDKVVSPARIAAKELEKDKLENESDSTVYRMKEEIEEAQDTKGRKDAIKDLDVRKKVNDYLMGKDAGDMTECEILDKATDGNLDQLPSKVRDTCAKEDPKFKLAAEKSASASSGKKAEADDKSERRVISGDGDKDKDKESLMKELEQARVASQQMSDTVSSCLSAYRNAAMQAQMGGGQNGWQSGMQSMLKKMLEVPSVLMAKMIDTGSMGMPLNPMMDFMGKAVAILQDNYPLNTLNKEDFRKLQSELSALDLQYQQLTGFLQQYNSLPMELQMQLMNDPEYVKMKSYQQAAGAMADALRAHLNAKKAMNFNSPMGGMSGNGYGTAGVPVVGGNNANTNGWRPVDRSGTATGTGTQRIRRRSVPATAPAATGGGLIQ